MYMKQRASIKFNFKIEKILIKKIFAIKKKYTALNV